jgi:hypothetical protein
MRSSDHTGDTARGMKLRASRIERMLAKLAAGRLHVRHVKSGTPSVHPLQGDELRALRRLQREQAPSLHMFSPMTAKGFNTSPAVRG